MVKVSGVVYAIVFQNELSMNGREVATLLLEGDNAELVLEFPPTKEVAGKLSELHRKLRPLDPVS